MYTKHDVPAGAGQRVLAAAVLGLGVVSLLRGDGVSGFEPVPAMGSDPRLLGYVTGVVLAGAGVALLATRTVRWGALALATAMAVWLVSFHVPNLAQRLNDGRTWTITFETVAFLGIAARLAAAGDGRESLRRAGTVAFAVALLVFGVLHVVYAQFVATLIPPWIPGRLAWAYGTGVAFGAAAASITTGIQRRLAAALLAAMFGGWVILLHAPRVAAELRNPQEWTSMLIALAMCGSGWLVADSERAPVTPLPTSPAPPPVPPHAPLPPA